LYRSVLRPILILFGLIGLGAYATIMLRGPQGVGALDEKRRVVRQLEDENATLLKDIDEKKQLIRKLQKDPGTQERYVRERTGKTKPGDTSFVVSDHATPPQH
jgi:cell division protein FtsB